MRKTKLKEADAGLFAGQEPPIAKEAPKPQLPAKAEAKKPKPAATKAGAVVKFEPRPPKPDVAVDDLIILARAAADKNVDPAKMQALRELMKDIRQERREEAFTRDFLAMQGELPEINKDSLIVIKPKETARNQATQKTPYASFQNIHRMTMPILRKHNFVIWDETEPGKDGTGVVVHTYLKHVGGHQIHSSISLILDTSGSKNNNQGAGSSISYGKRYNRIGLLNIISYAPEDQDNDGNPGRAKTEKGAQAKADAKTDAEADTEEKTITGGQAKDLLKAIDDCGVTAARFIEKYQITAVQLLPARLFDEAMKSCRDYKAAREGQSNAKS